MMLSVQNLSFSYNNKNLLLRDICFTLDKGRIYTLMGTNGAGKTTLFNILTGFIKSKKGSITFYTDNITDLTPFKINRKGICRTFQDLRIITKLSVKENIVLAMKNNPSDSWYKCLLPKWMYKKTIFNIELTAERLIANYFLADVENNLAGDISYGQQKLLTLACCVANNASLLLLDEPVAGINPEYRNKIIGLLRQLREQEKTILLIEHNTDFISEVADEIFFLNEGKLSFFENIELLRTNSEVINAYM